MRLNTADYDSPNRRAIRMRWFLNAAGFGIVLIAIAILLRAILYGETTLVGNDAEVQIAQTLLLEREQIRDADAVFYKGHGLLSGGVIYCRFKADGDLVSTIVTKHRLDGPIDEPRPGFTSYPDWWRYSGNDHADVFEYYEGRMYLWWRTRDGTCFVRVTRG